MVAWPEELIARKDIPAVIVELGLSAGELHEQTIRRWYTRGVRGVVLEVRILGGRVYTTRSRLHRFFEQLNSPVMTELQVAKTVAIQPFSRKRAQRVGDRLLSKIAKRRA